MSKPLSSEHINELQNTKYLLENPSVAAKFANSFADPIEQGMKRLPAEANKKILMIASKSLEIAMNTALWTLKNNQQSASNLTHKAASALSGAAGGAFGLAALAIELPISTTIMLRSIADVARSEGENLSLKDSQLACLEVFALGGKSNDDDLTESSYFEIRTALAGGALINTLFIDHFQDVARGHFVVRRLERTYDSEIVRASYEKLSSSETNI